MSKLSETFGQGKNPNPLWVAPPVAPTAAIAPVDNSDAIAAALRLSAPAAARSSAMNYFSGRGVDPNQYAGDIDAKINEILGTTASNDTNLGSYFSGLGENVYNSSLAANREKALRSFDTSFGPGYERSRISDTLDDPIISQIAGSERSKADNYVNNLLKRGVITDTGFQGAEKKIDDQGAGVRTFLDSIGHDALSSGRQNISDILNRGRTQASTLDLGTSFDPSAFGSEADASYNDFISRLPDLIKSKVSGDLFDTKGLAAAAGAASGAQNTKFDPKALAGVLNQDDPNAPSEEDKKKLFGGAVF